MDLIKGGALFAVIIGFWDKIKSFLWFLFSIFIEMAEIKKEDTCGEIIGYLFKNHRYIKSYDKVFSSRYEYFRNGKYGLVPYEILGNSTVIFFTNRRFFFNLIRFPFIYTTNTFSKSGNNDDSENTDKEKKSYIFSLRGTFNIYNKMDQAIK